MYCKLVVRLQNVNATDKLNKQCNRTECNVTVLVFENFGRCMCVCVCVCVTITLHSANYYCLFLHLAV